MRSIQKIMIGIFCFGVLLTGIGAGVAFSEFSSFRYMGEVNIGEVEMKTETFEQPLDTENRQPVRVYRNYWLENTGNIIEESEDIPENVVRFVITYNAGAIKPYVSYYNQDKSNPYISLSWRGLRDDFGLYMEYQDEFLRRAKNKEWVSFNQKTVEEVKILVNPASRELVYIE